MKYNNKRSPLMHGDTLSHSGERTGDQNTLFSVARVFKAAAISLELGLLILLVKAFQIEGDAFLQILILMLGGFLIHTFLPLRYRMGFFAVLSLAGILLVMGLGSGMWIIGLGWLLIGICHLPFSLAVRVVLLLLVTGFLVVSRLDWVHVPWSGGIWPILGSMFMFRLIIYIYDLKHEKNPPTLPQIAAYFFMLPNVCFPLFPVIDFKKFNRLYYNEDEFRIYQRGIKWMLRGIVHLLLYRYVYHNLTLAPIEVDGLGDMVQFSLSSFLLYLRVSGLFHLIVGMLLIFGFNLPETHHLYYLASGFAEFWRRINIYWKDFMMKIFYYPMRFKLRKMSETKAIVVSTLTVFFLTWFLHAWQWFWLRGTMLLEWHDALFWGVLALLVIVNSIYEIKHGMHRSLGRRKHTPYYYGAQISRTLATFISICLLWSMWSSDSLSQWISMWKTTGYGWLWLVFVIPALFIAANLLSNVDKAREKKISALEAMPVLPALPAPGFWKTATLTCIAMSALLVIKQPFIYSSLPLQAAVAVESVLKGQLNDRDMAQVQRGYYEHLISVSRNNPELWEALTNRPKDWVIYQNTEGWRSTNDFLDGELLPGASLMFKGAHVTINEYGMRDELHSITKPEDTWRVAMLGASHVFGAGVEQDKIFAQILEDKLNENPSITAHTNNEVLNFGTPERLTIRQLIALENNVLKFGPDALIYVAHTVDKKFTLRYIAKAVRERLDMPYPYLASIVERAGIRPDMNEFEVMRRLSPFGEEVLSWSYREIARLASENGIAPVWVLLPMTKEQISSVEADMLQDVAEKAGFIVSALPDVYSKTNRKDIVIAEWDDHPNAIAHQLVADSLYDILIANRDRIFNP